MKYTLEEARRELARRECTFLGHDLQIIYEGLGEPKQIVCERGCGHPGWTVRSRLTASDVTPKATDGG